MGLKLRNNSIGDIILLENIIRNYMTENNVEICHVDEKIIQERYDEIMDKISKN